MTSKGVIRKECGPSRRTNVVDVVENSRNDGRGGASSELIDLTNYCAVRGNTIGKLQFESDEEDDEEDFEYGGDGNEGTEESSGNDAAGKHAHMRLTDEFYTRYIYVPRR
jgi:hypothetical protein